MTRILLTVALLATVAWQATGPGAVVSARAQAAVVSDSAYATRHPMLLFDTSDLPDLYAQVRDGGYDDSAYAFIRYIHDQWYSWAPLEYLMDTDYALEPIQNLCLAHYLESPLDTDARDLGKSLVMYVVNNYDVDSDVWGSAIRLRSLALGYDMLMDGATPTERQQVVDEVESYIDHVLTDFNYYVWYFPPYVSNKSAMISAALGLAAISLRAELDPAMVTSALTAADDYLDAWLDSQMHSDGSYQEGALYGMWSFRHLVYYFAARERYDGTDYSSLAGIRNFEKWLAYELDPRGGGRLNNIQDLTDYFLPLGRHVTYLDWAQSKWGSNLSAYIFEYAAGQYGVDQWDEADKVSTVLWNRSLPLENPGNILPNSRLWQKRGLYYYRSGWPDAESSDDVVFSFYSGPFQGGHAQEDQNQFTIAGFGEKLASDHGAGGAAKQSEAHSIVLIDGAGQHNAGSSIGTDGAISAHLIAGEFDFLEGDATLAYSTHSPLNNPDVPFLGADWSWGYFGENPVLHAYRRVLVAHASPANGIPAYFVIEDDIEKDGTPHDYAWRLHTLETNSVDISGEPAVIGGTTGEMRVHTLRPDPGQVSKQVLYFSNNAEDPNSNVLSVETNTVNPHFVHLLLPLAAGAPGPVVTTVTLGGVSATYLDWGGGVQDVVITNIDGGAVAAPGGGVAVSSISTDARLAIVRVVDATLHGYVLQAATSLTVDGEAHVVVNDGALNVGRTGGGVHIDRADADFEIRNPGGDVYYRDDRIPTIEQNGVLTPAAITSAQDPPAAGVSLGVRAFPNPFNPSVTIVLEADARQRAAAAVYDVSGRLVRPLWTGVLEPGEKRLTWDGIDARGRRVASGVYFLRVFSPTGVETRKLTVLK